MRKIFGAALLAFAVTTAVLVPGAGAGAADGGASSAAAVAVETQRTLFDHQSLAGKDRNWIPVLNQPANYVAPANYRDGKAYLRVVVSGKPSTKPLWLHVCMWRHNGLLRYFWETCSTQTTFATNGTYFYDLGVMGTWWKKNGVWDWTKPASDIRLMLRDPITGKLMLTKACGVNCYTRPDIDLHVPLTMKAEFVLVGKGATLTPPAAWVGKCPKTWAGC